MLISFNIPGSQHGSFPRFQSGLMTRYCIVGPQTEPQKPGAGPWELGIWIHGDIEQEMNMGIHHTLLYLYKNIQKLYIHIHMYIITYIYIYVYRSCLYNRFIYIYIYTQYLSLYVHMHIHVHRPSVFLGVCTWGNLWTWWCEAPWMLGPQRSGLGWTGWCQRNGAKMR